MKPMEKGVKFMESFQYYGYWWIPENIDNKIAGILNFDSDNGAKLDLLGTFEKSTSLMDTLKRNFILGITQEGKRITLYKCLINDAKISIPGLNTSSYSAEFVFVGAHFLSEEDIIFDKVDVNLQYSEKWANLSGFDIKEKFDNEESPKLFTIEYNIPKIINVHLYNGTNISIQLMLTGSYGSNNVNLMEKLIFSINPDKPQGINSYIFDIFYKLECFLTLAIGEPVYPMIIRAWIHSKKEKNNNRSTDVLIYYLTGNKNSDSKKINLFNIIFSLRDIKDNLEIYLNNWFKKFEYLKPVYELYFSIMYNYNGFLESEFLTLIQAIESYHRRTMSGIYLTELEFEQVYNILIDSIPKDLCNDVKIAFKEKLKYLNEFSLRNRLKDLYNKYKDILDLFINDPKKFINYIVNTRNYLTHYDKNLERKALKDQHLIYCTEQLKVLLQIIFLSELGFSQELIKNIISINNRYKYIREYRHC